MTGDNKVIRFDDIVLHSTVKVKDFSCLAKGAETIFIVKWGFLSKAQSRIGSSFARINGKVRFKTLYGIDPSSGESSHILIATVVKPGRGRKKSGRPTNKDNKPVGREIQVLDVIRSGNEKPAQIKLALKLNYDIDLSKQRVDQIIQSLIEKGFVERLGRGLYGVVPASEH